MGPTPWRDRLPRGQTLPAEVWQRRHRAITTIAWLHVPLLALFGVLTGHAVLHSVLDAAPVGVLAAFSGVQALSRRGRSTATSLALLTASAILVHLWDGRIEAHFHFFVMVALLATYEEWFTYLVSLAYVFAHHGVMGALGANVGAVFDHAAARRHPWAWAAIHAGFIGALAVVNVVSWRMNEDAREASRESGERFRSAFDDAPTGMAIVGVDGAVQRVNKRLCAATGHPEERLVGMRLDELMPAADRDGAAWPDRPGDEVERRLLRADGSVGWALWQHSLVRDAEGRAAHWVSHCLDISARKSAELALDHQANHDPLTGLPNRALFLARLRSWTAQDAHDVAVIFVDLDNFKLINDSLGHDAGDRLLITVAERLRSALRPGDVIARFGGDEFAVGLRGTSGAEPAQRVAERLAGALRPPIELDGQHRYVTASFGVRAARAPGAPAEVLLRDADAAMYRAKELGKARSELFETSMHERAVERLDLESGLRHALERGELQVHYQPQVDVAKGRIVGVEATVRWAHPTRGLLPPDAFVGIAEQSGLIVPIGAWVLREACRAAVRWADDQGRPLRVAVDVSPGQVAAGDLPVVVEGALRDAGLEPGRLTLEISEQAVMADPDAATLALERLKRLGVGLAIDGFGIGYSSLAQLKALLPVDTVKIDKSFVDGITERGDDRAVVDAVLRLAERLGLQAVAEGVETPEQAKALLALDCGLAQGGHFSRPRPASDIDRLLSVDALGELIG